MPTNIEALFCSLPMNQEGIFEQKLEFQTKYLNPKSKLLGIFQPGSLCHRNMFSIQLGRYEKQILKVQLDS